MKKLFLGMILMLTMGISCVDVEPLAIFVNSYGSVDSYNFSDSLSELFLNDWRYIPYEASGTTDMIFIKAPDTAEFQRKLIIFYYGNGYNLYYSTQMGKLFRKIGFNTLSSDYYGFGRTARSIKPSEALCYQGAAETVRYAIDSLRFGANDIILCGFSLGTGVAIEMATRNSVGAVLLFAPFLNIATEVKTVSGGYNIPSDWFTNAVFDNSSKISSIHAPLCMFVGENDCLVDPKNMEELYKNADNPKLKGVLLNEDHPDFPSDSFLAWKDLCVIFFRNYLN